MSSYYDTPVVYQKVDVDYLDWEEQEGMKVRTEQRCMRCKGTGMVYVHDQETDCLNCEGYGTILV